MISGNYTWDSFLKMVIYSIPCLGLSSFSLSYTWVVADNEYWLTGYFRTPTEVRHEYSPCNPKGRVFVALKPCFFAWSAWTSWAQLLLEEVEECLNFLSSALHHLICSPEVSLEINEVIVDCCRSLCHVQVYFASLQATFDT